MKTKAYFRDKKYQAILDRATALYAKGKTETFLQLAGWLNKSGFKNNAGDSYPLNPRGIAKVVAAAHSHAESNFGKKKALPITKSFTSASGDYAWNK